MVDFGKLLDGINEGIRQYTRDAFTFPAAEELPPIPPPTRGQYTISGVQPPSGLYLEPDAVILISTLTTIASVQVRYLFLTLGVDGEIHSQVFETVPATAGTVEALTVRLGEGWLLSGYARSFAVASTLGRLYTNAVLIGQGGVGNSRQRTLMAGYVTGRNGLSYPEDPPQLAAGIVRAGFNANVTAPGAGNAWTQTVPDGAIWELLAVQQTLTTNATVANRRAFVTIDAPTLDQVVVGVSGTTQTASQTRLLTFGVGLHHNTTVVDRHVSPLLAGLQLPSGTIITGQCDNLQAGDAFTDISLFTQERIDF